jgi:hypothetical protein
MSTMTHQIQAEPIPAKRGLITLARTAGDRSVKRIKWTVAAMATLPSRTKITFRYARNHCKALQPRGTSGSDGSFS